MFIAMLNGSYLWITGLVSDVIDQMADFFYSLFMQSVGRKIKNQKKL